MTRTYRSHNPRFGSKTNPPLNLSFFMTSFDSSTTPSFFALALISRASFASAAFFSLGEILSGQTNPRSVNR